MKLRYSEAAINNEKKLCSVKGCTNNRHIISRFCNKHKQRQTNQGHPTALPIRRKDYAIEKQEVTNIIELNIENQAIQHGIEFFDKTMKDSISIPESELWLYLSDAGVTGKELLIEASAIYLLSERNRLILDDNHLTTQIGNKVVRVKGYRGGHLYGGQCKKVGKFIRENIGIVLLNICRSANVIEIEEQRKITIMNTPLNVGNIQRMDC